MDFGTVDPPFLPMPDHDGHPGFGTRSLPADPDTTAPDGSQVRVLLSLAAGSAAHFQLAPAAVSRAGRHRTVMDTAKELMDSRSCCRAS